MSATTTHTINATNNAGVRPAPPEAHPKADLVQIAQADLDRHCLSGEFFITTAALAQLAVDNVTLDDALAWFNAYPDSITVGETHGMSGTLQAFFGYDHDKPNGRCFFVRIQLASR